MAGLRRCEICGSTAKFPDNPWCTAKLSKGQRQCCSCQDTANALALKHDEPYGWALDALKAMTPELRAELRASL